MDASIRVLIVDDEEPGRERVATVLSRAPDVEIVGEATDGLAALEAIETLGPDLVFLDVRMPELDGLGVVEALDADPGPHIVFVTVHDEYMERAFAVHALDYVRKPFSDERLLDALEHARRRILERRGYEATRAGVLSLLATIRRRAGRGPDRLVVRLPHERKYRVVRSAEIEWVEARDKATLVHVGKETVPWARTLGEAERLLDRGTFMRVGRSAIVNKAMIVSIEPLWKGEYSIKLRSGKIVGTGRTYRGVVEQFLAGVPAPLPG